MNKTVIQTRLPLGQVLLNRGVVSAEQIDKALERQKVMGHNKLLGELLVEMEFCTDNQICSALAEAYGVPYAPLSPKLCDHGTVELLPRDFLEEYVVLPLFKVHDTLTVAISEPSNVFVIEEIQAMHKEKRPVLVGTTSVDVSETLSRMLG